MDYKKTLVILSGERGRGCVTVETTALGSKLRCGVKPIEGERLYVAVKDGERVFVREIDGNEALLPFEPSKNAHYMVIDRLRGRAVLYGTQSKNRLWQANMTDGVMKYVPKDDEKTTYKNANKNAVRQGSPAAAEKYDDEAIASANYFPKEYPIMSGFQSLKPDNGTTDRQKRTLSALSREYLSKGVSKQEKRAEGVFALQKKYVISKENVAAPFSREREVNAAKKSVFGDKRGSAVCSEKAPGSAVSIEKRRRKVVPLQADFFDQIRPKIEKLFASAERVQSLEKSMPDTKWVRVPCGKNGYYVVGVIGSRPDFVAYGLPGDYKSDPPEELGEDSGWWAFDPENPAKGGVWILYQDAKTGESVRKPF